jgi:hypothetical protein
MVKMTGLHIMLDFLQLGHSDAFPATLLAVVLVDWHRAIVSIPWKPSWAGFSLLPAWMTWFCEMLHFFGVVSTCASLCWLPAAMVAIAPVDWLAVQFPVALGAVVVVDWLAALCFLWLRCSTSLTCCARAGRAVVGMTGGKMLSVPGTPKAMGLLVELGGKQVVSALTIVFHESSGCPGGWSTCIWDGGMPI